MINCINSILSNIAAVVFCVCVYELNGAKISTQPIFDEEASIVWFDVNKAANASMFARLLLVLVVFVRTHYTQAGSFLTRHTLSFFVQSFCSRVSIRNIY